jgi:hypothetical protein
VPFLGIRADLTGLVGDDLEQFIRQANEVAAVYEERERSVVAGALSGLALVAWLRAATTIEGKEWPAGISLHTPLDPTAPREHSRDDIGTLMARCMAMEDGPETRAAVRIVWRRIVVALSYARDELELRGTGDRDEILPDETGQPG